MMEQLQTSLHVIIPLEFDESAALGLDRLFLLGEKADRFGFDGCEVFL
jgi:hypothetical protein